MELLDKDTDLPVGDLANYTISRDAVPLNPEDSGGQIVSFSAVVTNTGDYTDNLIGKTVALRNSYQANYEGDIVNYSRSDDSSLVSLDVTSILSRLNTTQTVLPYLAYYPQHEKVIGYWMQECGIFGWTVAGDVQAYVGNYNVGYLKNQVPRLYGEDIWPLAPSSGLFPGKPTKTWTVTNGDRAEALSRYPSKPLIFATSLSHSVGTYVDNWATEWTFAAIEGEAGATKISLSQVDGVFTLRERVGSGAGTVIGTLASPSEDGPSWVIQNHVRVLAQPNAADPTMTDFQMQVVSSDGNTLSSVFTYASVLKRDVELLNVQCIQNEPSDYDSYPDYYGYVGYINEMPAPAMPYSRVAGFLYSPTTAADTPASIPGFTGNVWAKIKEFCAIYDYDLQVWQGDQVFLTSRVNPDYETYGTVPFISRVSKAKTRKQISNREESRFVDVVVDEYPANLGSEMLLWKAESVYSIEKGENKRETVQTDASFISLSTPAAVTGVPVPYTWSTGAYVITGADGYIVDPAWWRDSGGYIKARPTAKSGEIELEFQAPNMDTPRAPYRVSEGVADRPALYISGVGMKKESHTIRVATGNWGAAQELGTTYDSGFILNDATGYRVGNLLAGYHGGDNVELSFTDTIGPGTSNNQGDGSVDADLGATPENSLIYHNGSIFRVAETRRTPRALEVSKAIQYDPIVLFDNDYSDMSVDEWDAAHLNELVREVDLAPMKKYIG